MRRVKKLFPFFMIAFLLSVGITSYGISNSHVAPHKNALAGTLLPGQQIWNNGVSSYVFGSNDTEEWSWDNVESDPHHIIQPSLKSAGFTLMRSFFFEHSLADNHLMTDAEIDLRLTTISNSGMQCLAVLANANDVTFNKHLIQYAGNRCSMYEFGNEPDNNGISAQSYVNNWNTQIPQLRAVNPNALFFGPALAYSSWNTAFMQAFLQGAKASGVLPDGVTFHWYPCWQESKTSCLTKATSYSGLISYYRNLTQNILGINLPIGITEWGNDPGSNTSYDSDPAFEQQWFTTALNNIIQGGADFANQFDVQSYSGYGTLDMFNIFNNDQPKAQFKAIAAVIAQNKPDVTPTPGSSPSPALTPDPSPTDTPTAGPSPTLTPSPSPTPTGQPVSKVWYFAEGRAGGGFKEFLTLGNPTVNDCQVNITYLTQPDSGPGGTKTVSVSVPASQRVTEWVDGDLGTSPSGPGISDAATVTVNTATTPNCSGIVVERPMYFNALGTNSGSDVLGVTNPGTTFYFADLATGSQPDGGTYSSFLPILNPGISPAVVTATYYAGGQQVGVQSLTVAPNSRGTIFPSQASPSLPGRVSVVLTSTQPVVSERPTYFSGINAGNAGIVSGGADVVGVQQLASDWLFAEGYTGGHFQENFVIANLDHALATAQVTITLEYNDGTSHVFPVTIPSQSQVIWNVNTNGIGATSQSVSAEITSSGAMIAVEREMYFGYNHVSNGRTTLATGGTDVLGQVGPAQVSAYSFAEGYTNVGYDEWLTIQNPTSSPETVIVTAANAVGTVYSYAVQVMAHSRYTLDMVAIVIQHMFHPADGYKGYEISLEAQSSDGPFVVERPMYWNASGTLGGSDVIGYAGV